MKLGLCLSGGGIKGSAHIGALKALEEENLKFNYIAGTSSGSIVSTLYACNYSPEEMYDFFLKYGNKVRYIDFKNILKIIYGLIFKRRLIVTGLNNGEILERIINEACNKKGIYSISQLTKSLIIPSVDSESGKVFIFNSCNLNKENKNEKFISNISIGKAVRASCSYPVVFSPCPYNNTNLLDGGIKENLPWRELKQIGCDKIISINFENKNKKKCCSNIVNIAERSFELMGEELKRHELKHIDFLHTIKLDNVSLLETEKTEDLYKEGYIQTKKAMNKIKDYINKK